MSWKILKFDDGAVIGIVPQTLQAVCTRADAQDLENKTLVRCGEANGTLSGASPTITAGVWSWTLTAASNPTVALADGQSCTLLLSAGVYSVLWPGGTPVGAWPAGLDAGVNVIVLFRMGGVLYRRYAGVAA